jgi:mannosyl-glycoprotein endo-beta-N-acetylglucosaminidase
VKPNPATPAPVAITKYVDVPPTSSLNMRKGPSTSTSFILKLARGMEVTVISENNGWAKVKAYGQEGYVSTDYLSSNKPGESEGAPPPTNEPDNPPTPPVDESNTGETQPGKEPNNGEIPNESETTEKYVNVDPGTNLNMRSGPYTNSKIITKLASGTIVTVYAEENGWARISANGIRGFVSAQYLSAKVESNPDTSNEKIVTVYTNYDATLDDLTQIQMKANPQTDKSYPTYIREDALVLNNLVNPTQGTVQGTWNVRGGAGTENWVVGKVNDGQTLQIISKTTGTDGYVWYKVNYNKSWVNASPEDTKYYLDPNNFIKHPVTSFQFLKLSESTSLDQFEVNERILAGKGILEGHAATFIAASAKYGVNDIYLISHALLETGNGRSELAKGVEIYGKTVYNMFGIGAYDGDAINTGAKFAYNAGWFTPEAAIIGGAQFIAQGYISKGQDTIYKMRWNPDGAVAKGVATHQYATDVGWATKQVNQIYNLYSLLDNYKVTFEVPVYKLQQIL